MKYTIRHNGTIVGTYSGADKEEALNAYAQDHKHADFKSMCKAMGWDTVEHNHKLEEVEE